MLIELGLHYHIPEGPFSHDTTQLYRDIDLGLFVQSVVSLTSLTSSLRVISLIVIADSIHNILIFFAEKM